MMVTLKCAYVGARRSAFCIRIDTHESVSDLKKAMKARNSVKITCDAKKLQLFLAKTKEDKWLSYYAEDVKKLKQGEKTPLIKALTSENLELEGEDSIADALSNMETPTFEQLHVLVVVPVIYVQVGDDEHESAIMDELAHYRQQGELIQRNCKDYCQQILSKIDELYALPIYHPMLFVCVEGSSGMGKSQLAFALGGSRPWFYWPTYTGEDSQRLYKNFSSISEAFFSVTNMDSPTSKYEENIFDPMSYFYTSDSLWTYGFIRALLEYCSEEQGQHGQMIRFHKKMVLLVDKCKLETVIDFREKIKADGKALPFFVLDETTLNMQMNGGEKNLLAFQRNVFRVCGLVVVFMGSEATMAKLIYQSHASYQEPYAWTTIIPRFPPYQPIPFRNVDKQIAWDYLQAEYPVLKSIVVNSRGLFARYFIDGATQHAVASAACGVKLYDLLDVAFVHVSLKTQVGKGFMEKQEGKDAQLMAISYESVGTDSTSPPSRKKRKADYSMGIHCMHLHFANLVDQQATELMALHGRPSCNHSVWNARCYFPTVGEDVLLYLAVLGGKTYSGYYDHLNSVDHSTLRIFSMYLKGRGFVTEKNTNAKGKFFLKTFENMVAHMIFCASRRNGVQGIPFDDFFAGLLSEFQDQIQPVTMMIGSSKQMIVASDLLDKYAALADLSRTRIPFLAPPNAEWPQWILDTRGDGCNFGHVVRAWNDQRCDVYVCNMEDSSKSPLFLCECKHWDKNVDDGVMNTIICELESVWKENWAIVLVFCEKIATFQTMWNRRNVGCVKVDCQSGCVDWVFQPANGNRKKLVIAMETGYLGV